MAEKSASQADKSEKRPVGRPPLEFPEKIDDTGENVLRKIMNTPPKPRGEWDYEKRAKRQESCSD
ncbi:MAG: hypothetical protein OXG60_04705 [Chloroflexi bacterium]|nr:hypothetical protein [Chloroflexota bacterium]